MKKSLILFLMSLLMLAACAPTGAETEMAVPQATAVPTAEPAATDVPAAAFAGLMQVYKNEEAGFSLRLPSNWIVSEGQEAPFGTVYLVGAEPLAQGGPANNSIIVADAAQITAVQLAEQLQCGGGCDAPALTEVNLPNGIAARFALIGGNGSPLLPWYFVEHEGKLVALSFHDSVNTDQSLDAIVHSLVFGTILESGGEEMTPLQAARQALATELGVNPYALVMESITSTEWPDSCLGVHAPEMMCAQMVIPGYAITLSLQDRLYQVNSNADGSQVVRVPASGAPAGGLSLTRQEGDICSLALVQPGSGVKSGPCDGQLTAYAFSSDAAETAAQLKAMMATISPFYSETAVGTLNVNGLGPNFASSSQIRQMAELARWLTETAVAGRASAADHLVFSWHREGGIAGFCDNLAVYSTGLAQLTSCKGTNANVMLSNEELTHLYDWSDTLQSFDFEQADPVGAADGMRITVMFKGNGDMPPTEAQKQAVLTLADEIYGNGSIQAAAYRPITEEACAALSDAVAEVLGVPAESGQAAFTDNVSGLDGTGCQIIVTGNGETFGTFLQVASQIDVLLTDRGWIQDTAYLADGPTGTATAYRLGNQLALFNVDWQPGPDANCPTDQPISACELTPAQQAFTITLNVAEMTTQ